MKILSMRILCALVSLTSASPLLAGSYVKNFTGISTSTTNLFDGSFIGSTGAVASVQSERLRLTKDGTLNCSAIFRLPDLDPGKSIIGFNLEFDLSFIAAGNPADGLSLNFGGLVLTDSTGPGQEGYQLPGGMVISFDTFANNPPETTRTLDVRIDGTQLVSLPESAFGGYQFNDTPTHVLIHLDENGLDMTFGATTVCNDLPVPGLRPVAGDRFAFSARTGSLTEDVYIDNINFTTTPTPPITRPSLAISEMVVDNSKYEDDHCQTPGYVEIYNGTNAVMSLDGWSLTDDPATPAKWTFPTGQSIPSFSYIPVFLGHGTPAPTTADTKFHTNFTLPKTGGFLGLYQGATKIDSFEPYPAQAKNVSYGHLGNAWTLGFLETPTPGLINVGIQAAGPPVEEEITWPRDGGLIEGPISLTLGAPATAGGQIRYTLDNSAPTSSSTLYDHTTPATISVSVSTNVRARIFAPGRLPGPVTSRGFLKLNSTITNYRGTGQPFNSNLPVIVIDSFNRSLDSENSATPGARPFRYTYAVVLNNDPANGNRTRVTATNPVDFQGRSGMHVRGESSSGMPQRQYSWETVDNEGNDKDVSILGMPAESDWVLYAPATDKTLLRNFIAYNTMRDTNGFGSAMRARLVEVFFNQPALGGVSTDTNTAEVTWADYRGVYVLVEKIKRGNDRVDIAKLDPCDTDPTLITGGYIFKKDKASTDPDFSTSRGQGLQIVEPATTVNDPQYTWLKNHVQEFENALYAANYNDPNLGYRKYIDEQSFMDNQWWVEIYKQIDGYRLSTYFSKDRGGKIKSAPLWDYNLSIGNAHYLQGYKYTGWYSSLVGAADYQFYSRLRQDPDYTLRHFDRYWKLRKTTFATPAVISRIDGYISQVTDGQPLLDITKGTGTWPNSVPSAEVPAARHHARWQRLGIWDWPNAPGWANRSKYTSSTDATDYANFAAAGYAFPAVSETDATVQTQGTAVVPMSEVVHLKSHLTNRLKWTDNGYILSNVILRQPVFSQEGGNVSPGYSLTIDAYTATPPAAIDYSLGGTLRYASGPVYYTTDGSEVFVSGGGAPSATAQLYSGPIVLNAATTIRARQFDTAISRWTPVTEATFVVSTVPASASNLVVSEIMYNPSQPTAPEIAAGYNDGNMFEYLEVMNIGNSSIDLSGVTLTLGVTFAWPGSIPNLRVLGPGERALIVGNLGAFNMRYQPGASVKIVGVFSGNLSNGGEEIVINSPGGVIKDFVYGDSAPWPGEADGAGYSLVLNNPASNPDHNLPQNWRASAEINGTPGAAPGASGPTGSAAAALADTDKDGYSDLLEYATGTAGNNGSSQPQLGNGILSVIVPPATTPSNYLTFEYKRSRSADGFSLDAEVSTGLSGWQPISSMFTLASQTNNADGTATIVWRSNQPASALTGRLFFHLRAGITP
jgi:hypothetical protein